MNKKDVKLAKKKSFKNDLTIEDSFSALEKIIKDLEDEKCSIEKSIELYEKGIELISSLNMKVEKIESDLNNVKKNLKM